MSDFQTTCQTLSNLDPYKRVNYVNGLVLGVDEFVQEQLYHLEKHRLHNRVLHGYGTVCGLSVARRATPQGPEIIVGPGIAVNPEGREIRLGEAHCAVLNHWLQRNRVLLEKRFGSPESLLLYLVLCHRECKTDSVPIPSGPCQSLDDSSTPSRIADAFELALRLDPPDQTEDNAVRELVALLGQIEISNAPGGLTRDEIENLVRSLVDIGSPPLASPPAGPLQMHPDQANDLLCAALRVWVTEVRPRLLPGDRNCASGPPAENCILLAELRFAIDTTVGGDFEVAGEVAIIEERRPYLLHTRLLQEWLLCGGAANLHKVLEAPRTFASLFIINPTTIRAWIHYPELLSLSTPAVTIDIGDAPGPQLVDVTQPGSPPDVNVFDLRLDAPLTAGNRITVIFDSGQITSLADTTRTLTAALAELDYAYLNRQDDLISAYLTLDAEVLHLDDLADVDAPAPGEGDMLTRRGAAWVAEAPPAQAGDHGALQGLGDDDHRQYLLADGRRALTGDLSAGGNRIRNLAAATSDGDAVRFEQSINVNDVAGGDLGSTYPNPVVQRLQQRLVANVAPQNGQVLTWNANTGAGRWEPRTATGGADDVVDIPPGVGPYAIVAAGMFDAGGQNLSRPFNRLRATQVAPGGDYLLNFPGYRSPSELPANTRAYIVKGTVIDGIDPREPAIFQFVRFESAGLRVRILTARGENAQRGFMVEISAYGQPPLLG